MSPLWWSRIDRTYILPRKLHPWSSQLEAFPDVVSHQGSSGIQRLERVSHVRYFQTIVEENTEGKQLKVQQVET